MAKQKVFSLGVAGGTGSGKSSVVDLVQKQLHQDVCVLRFDNYYKEHHDLPMEERNKLNYDCPDAFDMDLIYEHVKKLLNYESVESPVYDFSQHDRSDKTITVEPKRVFILEGIFALYDERINELLDTKVYVAVDKDERILRRLRRDVLERGRTIDSVMDQYLNTVKPMHEKYVAPTRQNANVVIPWGASNKVAMNMLIDHIRHYINMWDFEKNYGPETVETTAVFD